MNSLSPKKIFFSVILIGSLIISPLFTQELVEEYESTDYFPIQGSTKMARRAGIAIGAGVLGGFIGSAVKKRGEDGKSGSPGSIGSPGAVGPQGPAGASGTFDVPVGPAALTFTFLNALIASQMSLPDGSFTPLLVKPDGTVITGNPVTPDGESTIIEIPSPAQIGTYQMVLSLSQNTSVITIAAVIVTNSLNPAEIHECPAVLVGGAYSPGMQVTFEYTYSPTVIP